MNKGSSDLKERKVEYTMVRFDFKHGVGSEDIYHLS